MPIRGLGHGPSPFLKNMMNKILKLIAVADAIALPNINIKKVNDSNRYKGYEILNGQYCSEVLVGDIAHAYTTTIGFHTLCTFSDGEKSFLFSIHINDNSTVDIAYIEGYELATNGLIDWEKSGLPYKTSDRYIFEKSYFCLYFTKPLKATNISSLTNQYLSYTSPAMAFASAYDGFIPSYYYTSISGNESYFSGLTSVSSLITGQIWKSGDVSSLGIEKNGFIIQDYYVNASVLKPEYEYVVQLWAYAKSEDGQKEVNLIIQPRLAYVNLKSHIEVSGTYNFPYPVSTLEITQGYYNIIRSGGAHGLTDSIYTYQEGYKDGQANPTFKSFIVSAFEACSAFFSLPVLGQNITVGTLIGSFVGLGALFLLIRLFR